MGTSLGLRIGIVIIGLAILVALYLFGTRRNRNKRRFKNDGRLRQFNPVDVVGARTDRPQTPSMLEVDASPVDGLSAVDSPLREQALNEISLNDIAPIADVDIGELPKIQKNPKRSAAKKNKASKRHVSQIEMSFDDAANLAAETETKNSQELITLYVLPAGDHAFVGEFIIQSLNSVGLRFGDMDIFHHYGAGKLKTDTPLFSVANMVEPGTFDLKRIERFNTLGLVFFLQLPAALDGAVSFELFLNTAQRLTEALGGVLHADPKTPLDSPKIEEMRKAAAEF